MQYGAGLQSLSLTGTELTAGATSVDRFRESGQHTYTLEVTDSRGLTSTAVMMKNVVSYVPLVISATAQRAKDQNTPDATATGLRVAIRSSKAIAASRVSIRYRLASSGSWIATRNQALSVGETVVYIAGALATGSSYVVQVNATDGAMEVPYSEDIGVGTAYVFLHVDAAQKRFGVGALVETNSRFVIGSDMVPYWGTEKLATEKYVTDNEKDTTYGAATTSTAGLMSAADKVKLNGIATGANAYSLPAATGSVRGGITVGSGLSISGDKLSSINQAGITLVATSGPGALNSSTPYTTGYLKGVYYVVCVLGNGQRNGIWFVLPQLGNGTPIVTQVSATGSQITVEVGKYEAQDGSGDSCRITVRAAAGNSTVWVYQL